MRFRDLFQRKPVALTGAPAIRRMKTYSAQSGYVYQYYFEGYRPLSENGDTGTEFVFQISADRKEWSAVSVCLTETALRAWETAQARQLSSTERYAVAKLALFQGFDERAVPALMKDPIRVREADLQTIVETLDI
jgi:hypothetical protein